MEKKEIRKQTAIWAESLVREHPEVLYVYVFGPSLDTPSDPPGRTDVIVVLKDTTLKGEARIAAFTPKMFPTEVKVYPFTDEELANLVGEENNFVQNAFKRSTLIWDYQEPSLIKLHQNPPEQYREEKGPW